MRTAFDVGDDIKGDRDVLGRVVDRVHGDRDAVAQFRVCVVRIEGDLLRTVPVRLRCQGDDAGACDGNRDIAPA